MITLKTKELQKTSLNGCSFWYDSSKKFKKKSIKKLENKSIPACRLKVFNKTNTVAIIKFSFFSVGKIICYKNT